jgi:hypothetical protein
MWFDCHEAVDRSTNVSEALILIFSPELPSVSEGRDTLSSVGTIHERRDELAIAHKEQHIWLNWEVGNDSNREEMFEDWPLSMIPQDSHFIIFTYKARDHSLVRQIMIALADKFTFLIDTNSWSDYTSAAFANRCKLEPYWDFTDRKPPHTDENVVYLSYP